MLILEKLWHGQIDPSERQVREDSEYQRISHEAIECMLTFHRELSTEGKSAFDEYYEKEQLLADISEQDAFIKGVRIGAKIILDILGEYASQLPQLTK